MPDTKRQVAELQGSLMSYVKILILSILFIPTLGYSWRGEIYSQTTYLHKYKNPISQNKISFLNECFKHECYVGAWLDFDEKTGPKNVYTDSQFSPLAGIQSSIFGNEWLYSRYFLEGRYVQRLEAFTDDRVKQTYDLRAGFLGYGLKKFNGDLFLENYYALFFTRLYNEKIILQGWSKQGIRLFDHFDLYNEIFGDTFDQTRDRHGTLDLRPGVRAVWGFKGGTVQLLHQWLYHFTNLEFAGRSEERSTLVVGLYW